MNNLRINHQLLVFLAATIFLQCSDPGKLSKSVRFYAGDINGATIERNGNALVVYGDPGNKVREAEMVLFTHFRRDVIWAGRELVQNGSLAVVPAAEKAYFTQGDSAWRNLTSARFHDYCCQTTKIAYAPFARCRFVRGGETLDWKGIGIKVLDTPGFTRGSVSYLIDVDGKRYAFTGDLIYGDGKILDLYSFQDSLNGIGGYHGYAVRLGQLVKSLEQIAGENPDMIIPSRGPIIANPGPAIQKLISQVRALYLNYLSTSAYRWYFPERIPILSEHVIGSYDSTGFMSYSEVISKNPPPWFSTIGDNCNSRLVLAGDGSAFLVDCGIKGVFDNLVRLKQSGQLKSIDGVFITHYHDDHTDCINDVVQEFKCPVYVTGILQDILQNPGAYDLPCLTTDPIPNLVIMQDGQKIKWKDFTLTFYDFPGQTLYHDAVLFEKKMGEAVFFIGDSFTPSGIDDYCLLNRNLLHEGMGYFYCLDILKKLPEHVLLCNQHVGPLFAFSRQQLDFMTNALVERKAVLKSLLPWDDINYGMDEQWARLYPYCQKAGPGQTVDLTIKIFNHSEVSCAFSVKFNVPPGFRTKPDKIALVADPVSEKEATVKLLVPQDITPGTYLVTMDIDTGDRSLREWSEALIEVRP